MESYPPRPVAVAIVANDDAKRRFFIFALVTLSVLLGGLAGRAATLSDNSVSESTEPIEVTAADLVQKVYGVADPTLGRDGCRKIAQDSFSETPREDEGAEWMSSDEGFLISYQGQSPEAEAMVRYARNAVTGYGYIFYFPYESHRREAANNEQCRFCSALLGELSELGEDLGADPLTKELFDVSGIVKGRLVRLCLSESTAPAPENPDLPVGAIDPAISGEFILVMSVTPTFNSEFTAELAE